MPRSVKQRVNLAWLGLLAGVMLAACAQPGLREPPVPRPLLAVPVDLSGSWERDFSRGDDTNERLNKAFRRMQQSTQGPRQQNGFRGQGDFRRNVDAVIALARLADQITQVSELVIEQDNSRISIERVGDLPLNCEFGRSNGQQLESVFGSELCGWVGEQFVAHLDLPDGLVVSHSMTLSPDRQSLHVATTVASDVARMPFTLSRFYTRFEPLPSEYECVDTFSSNRVCSARGPEP